MNAPGGFLLVNKPSGVTSFAMVALVRRLTGVRRVGHAGTLDPLASGVLPVAVGQATRLIEFMDDVPKTYRARVRFGVRTDTYDAEGSVTSMQDASRVRADDIVRLIPEFTGTIRRAPPAFSAVKVAGKPLYRYAREGASVEPRPRTVVVHGIDLIAFADGVAELDVRCGKGTYIRSLAHDIGDRIGCGAHLAALQRTSSGGFDLAETHAPEDFVAAAAAGGLEDLLLAPDRAVERRPAAILDETHAGDVLAGRDVPCPHAPEAKICRAYAVSGEFLGVLTPRSGDLWHPLKVLPPD